MLKAVIFDLDGVLVPTDRLNYRVWKELADNLGIYFDEEINDRMRGVSRRGSLEIVLERSARIFSGAEKEAMVEERNEAYKLLVERLVPGDVAGDTRKTLAGLRGRGLKLAVGSSSKNALRTMELTGLLGEFSVIADGNCITHGKPDPEVFLKAAQLLGVEPSQALVVEDAPAGVQAAHNGGFLSAAVSAARSSPLADYRLGALTELLDIVDGIGKKC